jgi:hypothetical protein
VAITRTYGNITDALSLADKAGQGDAFRWQFNADTEYQKQLDSEQQQRNQQANAEITNSIHQQETNQQGQYQQGELGISAGRTQAELAQAAAASQRANAYDQMIAPSLANRNNGLGNKANADAGIVDPAKAALDTSITNGNNIKSGQATGAGAPAPYVPSSPDYQANTSYMGRLDKDKDGYATTRKEAMDGIQKEAQTQAVLSKQLTDPMATPQAKQQIQQQLDASNSRMKQLQDAADKAGKAYDATDQEYQNVRQRHSDRLAGKQPQAAGPSGKQVTPEVAKQYADQARKDNPNATPQQISALAKAAAQKDGYTISQ